MESGIDPGSQDHGQSSRRIDVRPEQQGGAGVIENGIQSDVEMLQVGSAVALWKIKESGVQQDGDTLAQ